MRPAVIAATGLYTPPDSISNAELVEAFNTYVARFNADNAAAIAAGTIEPLQPSSSNSSRRPPASSRAMWCRSPASLDPELMRPR